jgi:hypothetical protein
LHQVGDLFELNVKLRCQKLKRSADCVVWRERQREIEIERDRERDRDRER